MTDVVSALVSGFSAAATQAMGAIADILPVLIPVAAAIVVIGIGYRLFKRFIS